MALKLVEKVLGFMGFEEEAIEEEEEKLRSHERVQEEQPWQKKKGKERDKSNVISMHSQRQVKVVVVEPRIYDEAEGIAENLKNRRPVIVNLEQAESDLAKRILDFVSGATYALNGRQQKVGNGIFLFVPSNMDISTDCKDQNREKSMFLKMRL